jgi:hypothetical protein
MLSSLPARLAGQALAEYALTIVLCTLIIAPALHQTLVVLMAYYQLLIVAAAGG